MSYVHVQDESAARVLAEDLGGLDRFALDCEAAGFHRYSDKLCLAQLTTPRATYVVDPLAVDVGRLLRGPLEDPDVEVVMHGADYDLRLLVRDLDIRLKGLFDTQIVASLLGESALGLAALLKDRMGVELSKKYQRADWAKRPLTPAMLDYAADDTRYLLKLADMLAADIRAAGRADWAEEEARALEIAAVAPPEDPEPTDPVTRVKGARDLPPRQVAALRAALEWRDELARERDKAPFRVIGDPPLVQAAMQPPTDPQGLRDIKGFPGALARSDGHELLRRLQRVYQAPEAELVGYPRSDRRGPGRPPPEVEAMADRLKRIRNRRATEVGIDRGTLLPNAVLQAIAWEDPGDLAALRRVEGIKEWQVDVVGDEILETLLTHG